MISSDQTKGNDLSEKELTDVNNESNNRITSEDQTKKRKRLIKIKRFLISNKKIWTCSVSEREKIKEWKEV